MLFVLVIAAFLLTRALHLGQRLAALREWIEGMGAPGYVVFVALYVIAVVTAIPGSPITVLAGVLYGSLRGVIVVSIASTIGAGLAFLVARYFARDATARALSGNERFSRLYELTESHGAIIVAITRLVPLFPFNLLNYGFGLTKVRFGTYLLWSWLCMLPGTVLYVVGADAVTRAVARGEIPWSLVVIVIVMAAVVILLVRTARKRLADKEKHTQGAHDEEPEH
jgi:uncharacterized membrane protein YdjX (TVP38/TMEM64 family)